MPKRIESPVSFMDKSYSIIIPVHNEEKFIKRVLNAALLANTNEIIVVNDGSRDKTKDIVLKLSKKDPRIKLINHKSNLGIISSYRSGILTSKNDILVFFDADIKNVVSLMFEKLVKPIFENKAELVIGAFNNFGRITEFTIKPLLKYFFPQLAKIKQPLSGLFAIKKEFCELEKYIYNQKYGLIQIFLLGYLNNLKIKEVNLGKIIHDKRKNKDKADQAYDEIKVFFEILKLTNLNFDETKNKLFFQKKVLLKT